MTINTILLDIEGTTSPITFTYKVLFPYARNHIKQYLQDHRTNREVRGALQVLKNENAADIPNGAPCINDATEQEFLESASSYCLWLMSCDRKSAPLKSLQGLVWEQGFLKSELRGEVFADVVDAFARWQIEGRRIAIYSSGSVLAQNLLFRHTQWGDLTSYISFYFDTRVGAKRQIESYRRIAAELRCEANAILFISDVTEELDAARQAGLHTVLSLRPNNSSISNNAEYQMVRSFNELAFD
jgi:enolase-phosphatase E1